MFAFSDQIALSFDASTTTYDREGRARRLESVLARECDGWGLVLLDLAADPRRV